jgi:hypothetical protein
MNIDVIINIKDTLYIKTIETDDTLVNMINKYFIENDSIKVIKYYKHFQVDIMDESPLCEDKCSGLYYILCNYNKNINDVITNICCNYKFHIVLENSIKLYEIDSIDFMLKNFLKKFPILENYLNKPNYLNENTIPITLPVLFMINTKIKFKVYFNSIEEYSKSKIEFKYDCYTFSNKYIKELGSLYKKQKFISNNRGMIFEDGIMKHDFDLD